jgi:hypothetical protein
VSASSSLPSPARAVVGGDRLLALSRAGVVLLLVLAVANGLWLYVLPGRALTQYAWPIQPPVNAAFLGAGYLAGTVATALVTFRTTLWRSLRILPLPLVVLSLTMLSATLIHADRFKWGYFPTWVWTAVYAGVPAGVAILWTLQERQAGPPPAPDTRLRALRGRSLALGMPFCALAVGLWLAPAALAEAWPWPLTPLLARALGGWYALVGSALLCAAVMLRRAHEVVIPFLTLGAWTALLLLLPVLHAGDLATRAPALVLWAVAHVLLLLLAVTALRTALPVVRAEGQRL